MAFVIGLLTLILVLDCVFLVFLVLIQLPKKEAGAGLAFGGAASDALFGAGSGNVLTKITKYAAGTFFVLAIGLSMLQNHWVSRSASSFSRKLSETGSTTPAGVLPQPGTAPASSAPPVSNAAPATTSQAEQPVTVPPATPQPATTNTPAATK
jgi:preprotein translocase subunit SecG